MIEIKNSGSSVIVGDKICPGGGTRTRVDEDALKEFGLTPSGSFLLKSGSVKITDKNKFKKDQSQLKVLKAQAMSKVRQELGPVIEKEITKKLESEHKVVIKELESEYEAEIKSLKEKISELTEASSGSEDTIKTDSESTLSDNDDKTKDDKEFVFDSEKHHIEHRGGGNWFVMELEEKVFGPLSEEDRSKFEAMIED